jgi:hypothetical protein
MFDDMPNDVNGWGRDAVLKEYGKYIGVEWHVLHNRSRNVSIH